MDQWGFTAYYIDDKREWYEMSDVLETGHPIFVSGVLSAMRKNELGYLLIKKVRV